MHLAFLHPCPVCVTITIAAYLLIKKKKNKK